MSKSVVYCCECGTEVEDVDLVNWESCPYDTESTNEGESAQVCKPCHEDLTADELNLGDA